MLILCCHQEHMKREGTDMTVRRFWGDSGRNADTQELGWLRSRCPSQGGFRKNRLPCAPFLLPSATVLLRSCLETRKGLGWGATVREEVFGQRGNLCLEI